MSQFSQRNVRLGIEVEAERGEAQLLRLAQAQIRLQKALGNFHEAQAIAIRDAQQFATALDQEGRSVDSYIRHLKLMAEAAIASSAARRKAAKEAAEAETIALKVAQQQAIVDQGAADRRRAAAARQRTDMMRDIEARGSAMEHGAMVEKMISDQRAIVAESAARREADIRSKARRDMLADIEARGAAQEHSLQVERMIAEQRGIIQAGAAQRARTAAAAERAAMMAGIEARGGAGGVFSQTAAMGGGGPGFFSRLATGAGDFFRVMNRTIATFFLWQFLIRQIGGAIDTAIFRPIRSVTSAVLEASDAFRKVEVSLSGIVGSMRAVSSLRRDVSIASAGLPFTQLQALEAARAISYIPATARTVQNPENRPENLRQLFTILQGLSVINPRQGLQGAEFSLREALAGQFRSLRFRFDISPNVVAQAIGKSLQDLQANPELVIKALDKFVTTFVGPDAIEEMQRILSVQAGLFKGVMQEFFAFVGDQGIYDRVTGQIGKLVRATRAGLTPDANGNIALGASAQLLNNTLERLLNQVMQATSSAISGLIGHPFDLAQAIDKGDIAELANVGAELIDELRKVGGTLLLMLGDIANFLGSTGRFVGLFGSFDVNALKAKVASIDNNPGFQAYNNYQTVLAQKAAVDARIEALDPIASNPDLSKLGERMAAINERNALYTKRHNLTSAQRDWYEKFEMGIGGDSSDSGDFLGVLTDMQRERKEAIRRLGYLQGPGNPSGEEQSARSLIRLMASLSGDPGAALRVSGQATRASLTNILLATRENDIGAGAGNGGGIPNVFSGENSLTGRLRQMAQNWAIQMNPQQEGTFAANVNAMQTAIKRLEEVNAGTDPDALINKLREAAGMQGVTADTKADITKAIANVPASIAALKMQVQSEVDLMSISLNEAISTIVRGSVQGFSGLAPATIARQSESLINSGIRGGSGGPLDVNQLRNQLDALSAKNGFGPVSRALGAEDVPSYIQAIQARTAALGSRTRHYDDTDRAALAAARGDLGAMEAQLMQQLAETTWAGGTKPKGNREEIIGALESVQQAMHDLADSFDQDLQRMRQAADQFADDVEGSFRTALGDTLVHIVDNSANRIEDIVRNLGRSLTQSMANAIADVAIYWARVGLQSGFGSMFGSAGGGGGGGAGLGAAAAYAEGGMLRGPLTQIPGLAEGTLLTRTQGMMSDPFGQRYRTVESGTPEAMIPLRGGGVPVRWIGRGRADSGGGDSGGVTIINVVDSADVVRRGAAMAPDAIINPVVADVRGRGRIHKVTRRRR